MLLIALAMALALQSEAPKSPPPRPFNPNALPLEVRKAVVEVNTLCAESGGKPGKSPQLIKFVDLTGDGVTDFVMDLAFYDCQGAASAVSAGQSGNAVIIFVGGPNNTAKRAYDAVAQAADLVTAAGKRRLYVGVMGPDCGQRPSPRRAMSDVAVCSRPLNWDAARQVFVLAPMSEIRPFSVQ